MRQLRVAVLLFACLLGTVTWSAEAAAAATHTHQHHTKERMEDGSFSPRDAHHHEGGEHHTEFDHQAILGSVKKAKEYEELSSDEAKRRLAVLVPKMDLNGDQYVDRHELKAWILRSFSMLSEEEASERFDDMDTDKDNRVSWQEYLQDSYGFGSEDEAGLGNDGNANEEVELVKEDKLTFAAADINKDGFLELESGEFLMFLSPEEHPEMFSMLLAQTLRSKDLDKDGKISFQEYIGDSAKNRDKEFLVVEKERFDMDFDRDSDGALTGQEIIAWAVPSNEVVANEEVDHLFVSADDDHDDRLSYDEIIANYEIFVGSEATDYGEHLQNIENFRDEL